MNMFSVAQYTKPRFKDIQDRQKIAWISGISISLALNVVLAVLCGVWNNERLSLKMDKDDLQNDFNQCQNKLSLCQFNNSQKTCNNTIYKAGDKTISFNYTDQVTTSNTKDITDTIEIKDNGDIFINGQSIDSNKCGYYQIGNDVFFIDGLQIAPQEDIQNKIYLDQTQLKISLETNTIQKHQIYPIDENVLGDTIYVTNNKFTTISPGNYSLSVADNKIVKGDVQIWPFKDSIYTTISGNNYSISTPSNELFQWDQLDNSTQINILENGTITIDGKETTTETCKKLPQEIYLVNGNNYYKYDISNFEKDIPQGTLIEDITNEFIDGVLTIKNGTQQITPIGTEIYLPFEEDKYYQIIVNGSNSFTNIQPSGTLKNKLLINYINGLQLSIDDNQIYPIDENVLGDKLYVTNNKFTTISPGNYSLSVADNKIVKGDVQIWPVNQQNLYVKTKMDQYYKIDTTNLISQNNIKEKGTIEISYSDDYLNMPSIKVLNTNIFPIITDGVYIMNSNTYNWNKKTYYNYLYRLYNITLFQNITPILNTNFTDKNNNTHIYTLLENEDITLSRSNGQTTIKKESVGQIYPISNQLYYPFTLSEDEDNKTTVYYSVDFGNMKLQSKSPLITEEQKLQGKIQLSDGSQSNTLITIKGSYGDSSKATSPIYISNVLESENIVASSINSAACKINYFGFCLEPYQNTNTMNFYNVTYETSDEGVETIKEKKLYLITIPQNKYLEITNDTSCSENTNCSYGGTINIDKGVQITLSGTFGNYDSTGNIITLDQVELLGNTNINGISLDTTTIQTTCKVFDNKNNICLNPLPQTIYSQDDNGKNIYQITLPNNIVYKPSGNVQGTVSLNKDYQLSISGEFGSNTLSPTLTIQDGVKLLTSECQIMNGTTCINYLGDDPMVRWYKYTYKDINNQTQQEETYTEYIKFQFDQINQKQPIVNSSQNYNLRVNLQNAKFSFLTESSKFTWAEDTNNPMFQFYTVFNITKGRFMDVYGTVTGDNTNMQIHSTINTKAKYKVYLESLLFSKDNINENTICAASITMNENNINKNKCLYPWNNTFQIQSIDVKQNTYQIKINNDTGYYQQLFPDEYLEEEYIKGDISILQSQDLANTTYSFIQLNGSLDIQDFDKVGNMININASLLQNTQINSSVINITNNAVLSGKNGVIQEGTINAQNNSVIINGGSYGEDTQTILLMNEVTAKTNNNAVLLTNNSLTVGNKSSAPVINIKGNNSVYSGAGYINNTTYSSVINIQQVTLKDTNWGVKIELPKFENIEDGVYTYGNINADNYGIYHSFGTISGGINGIYLSNKNINGVTGSAIYIDNRSTLTSTSGLVGIQVPSLTKITGDKLVCEVSDIETPSSKQDCLMTPLNELTYKLSYTNRYNKQIDRYYTFTGPQENIYFGTVPTQNTDTVQLSNITLGTDHTATIKGYYGIDSTDIAITINPEVIYGYAHGIYIYSDIMNESKYISNIQITARVNNEQYENGIEIVNSQVYGKTNGVLLQGSTIGNNGTNISTNGITLSSAVNIYGKTNGLNIYDDTQNSFIGTANTTTYGIFIDGINIIGDLAINIRDTTIIRSLSDVGIKVPSFDQISIPDTVYCKISFKDDPSSDQECLTTFTSSNTNKISFKYTKDSINYYYTLSGPQANIYQGDLPDNSSTDIISTVELGDSQQLIIYGTYGDKELVDNGITITPVNVYGKTNSISIDNSDGTLNNQININTVIYSSTSGILISSDTQFENCENGIYINSGRIYGSNSGIYIQSDVGMSQNKFSKYGIYQKSGLIIGSDTGFYQEFNAQIKGATNGILLDGSIGYNNYATGIYIQEGRIYGVNTIKIDSSSILQASSCKIKNSDTCLLDP